MHTQHMLNTLEREVLRMIKPSDEEYLLVLGAYEKIAGVLKRVLAEHGVEADVTLQGSVAHDTWLSGSRDIDVFVLFPENWSREDIETRALPLLMEAAEQVGEYVLMYAEHPYVRLKMENIEADVVPAVKLRDPGQIKTAVDRTPFHTAYINSTLSNEQRDHVRLLKKFMKTIGVYGAEVKVRGFSGYAAELLVATYGSFRGVLEAASRWKPPVFVETTRLTPHLMSVLTAKYPTSCIYMPDPVDPERNVTASVSPRSLATFKLAAACYLRNPSHEFFVEPPEPTAGEVLSALEDRCVIFLVYRLRDRLPPDVIWGEVQRVASRLRWLAEVHGAKVFDYSVWSDEADTAVIAVEFESCWQAKYKLYRGPCVDHDWSHAAGFLGRHLGGGLGAWISWDGCLSAMNKRAVVRVAELVESKWEEYTVSPHLRTVKPHVTEATREIVEKLISKGAGRWLRDFAVKTPYWMSKCIGNV